MSEINLPLRPLTDDEQKFRQTVVNFNQKKLHRFINSQGVDISQINIGDVVVLTAEKALIVTSFQVTGLVVRNNVEHSFVYSNNRKIPAQSILRVIKAKRFGMAKVA